MIYTALARKWRPRRFEELVGQEMVLRALSNALQRQQVHHAYLFTGTRGVGKTTIARILAKCLNCESGVTAQPCGQCAACREIDEGRFVDLIEVDAASRTKVDDTRALLDNVQYAPAAGRYKVYLIDEVHMLSTHSFNALLKTLEEPPEHVKFLLATTDPQKLPVTVLSRCLQFSLKRLSPALIQQQLTRVTEAEKVTAAPVALSLLAKAADGSMRDALSLLDQAIAYTGGELEELAIRTMLGVVDRRHVEAILTAVADQDRLALRLALQALHEQAPDYETVLAELAAALQRMAWIQLIGTADDADPEDAAWTSLARRISAEDVQLYYQICLLGRRDLALAPAPQLGFEMTLLRIFAFYPGAADVGKPHPAPTSTSVTPQSFAATREPQSVYSSPTVAPSPARLDVESKVLGDQPSVDGDWPSLINQLGLKGMSRQLATNCQLQPRRSADHIELILNAAHAHLRSESTETRLKEALRDHLKQPNLKVVFSIGECTQPTPAAIEAIQQAEKVTKAKESIDHDPTVKAFVDTFGAEVQGVRPKA